MSLFISWERRRRLPELSGKSPTGKPAVQSPRDARRLALQLNRTSQPPVRAVSAAQLTALSLIEGALQRLLSTYMQRIRPDLFAGVLEALERRLGREDTGRLLVAFRDEFGLSEQAEHADETVPAERPAGDPRLLRELLAFWWLRINPAAAPLTALLHDGPFIRSPGFAAVGSLFSEILDRLPGLDESDSSLLDLLMAPIRAAPASLIDQLRSIRDRWGRWLGDLLEQITVGLDLAAEEGAPRFENGPGTVLLPSYDDIESLAPRYSEDRSWMESIVLVAKNALVWLHQLSREFGRPIGRLDEIPDEALATLARYGFSGLWLIGIWERSPASKRIKQLCGNADAEASAYAILRYRVAAELGGEEALAALRSRAAAHGIRLAADMVPNHVGVDSHWVIEHPEWILSEPDCPFPSYGFEGPDLSADPGVGIFLEDHYYERSDAAVVFKRLDRGTGEARYLYHGNDGTSTPWNDTAQINHLEPEARAAVIATIVDVARRFPVIRFDAAMTLTRLHYRRLWYPEPGSAGAIPSRAERALSRRDFDRRMPREFWREVVERVAREAPDTLLLAEAFWLMEGYFVRQLGMHRVYNSAFMHLLRDQENSRYRELLRETLAFDPRILSRYVNFMSNPDERTAVDQFGSEDRYFGVCVVMATLPGLPMFAHGQVEGLTEKYGMDFRTPVRQEEPDPSLVARHERDIAPLLRRRELFSGVAFFRLFDLLDDHGGVHEDVLAYTNGTPTERVLVVFNHRFGSAAGRLRISAPVAAVEGDPGPCTLTDALDLDGVECRFVRCRDLIGGDWFLLDRERLATEGLWLDLRPFEYRVLGSFEAVGEYAERGWPRLASWLGGRGVADLDAAFEAMVGEALGSALRRLLDPEIFGRWLTTDREVAALDQELRRRLRELWRELPPRLQSEVSEAELTSELARGLALVASLGEPPPGGGALALSAAVRAGLLATVVLAPLARIADELAARVDLGAEVRRLLAELGHAEAAERYGHAVLMALRRGWLRRPPDPAPAPGLLRSWLADDEMVRVLGVNRWRGERWLHKEALEDLLEWRAALAVVAQSGLGEPLAVERWLSWARALGRAAARAEYRVSRLAPGTPSAAVDTTPDGPDQDQRR